MNTSIGYHTFSFFQKLDGEEFSSLTSDFIGYANNNKDMDRSPISQKGWRYTYKENKGIRWFLLSYKMKNGFTIQGLFVIINPQALIRGNYIEAATEKDLKKIEKIYNAEAARISSIISKFGSCSLNRFDPCMNIDLKELGFPCTPEQMMSLIKQGNIPSHYNERKEYDEKQRKRVRDKDSFYLVSKSVVINYYWKYKKLNEEHPAFLHKEAFRNVIRLEVQCKYGKLYPMAKNKMQESKYNEDDEELSMEEIIEKSINGVYDPSIPIDIMISYNTSEKILRNYFYRILRRGDYLTLDDARNFVKSFNFRREKEERLLYALEMVNTYRGIANAKSNLHDSALDNFDRSLRDLDSILLNPVTIPRRWGIKHIPNLLKAFYDYIDPRYLVMETERQQRKRLDEFLNKME